MSKDKTYRKLINCTRWTELRIRKISKQPLCEACLEHGLYTPAQCVHHKTPCETAHSEAEMARLMYDMDNLMSLCRDCHRQIHDALKFQSKEAKEERKRDSVKRFEARFL